MLEGRDQRKLESGGNHNALYLIPLSFRNKDGVLVKDTWRVVCNIRNVTAKRVLEVETREKTDMLFANVSHELRTPLNGIIAMADVLSSSLKGKIDSADEES